MSTTGFIPTKSNDELPMFRELWKHIGKKMPKKGRGKGAVLDPLSIPVELQTALLALYGHYDKTYQLWEKASALYNWRHWSSGTKDAGN